MILEGDDVPNYKWYSIITEAVSPQENRDVSLAEATHLQSGSAPPPHPHGVIPTCIPRGGGFDWSPSAYSWSVFITYPRGQSGVDPTPDGPILSTDLV